MTIATYQYFKPFFRWTTDSLRKFATEIPRNITSQWKKLRNTRHPFCGQKGHSVSKISRRVKLSRPGVKFDPKQKKMISLSKTAM
jgi:hypothetical protein